MATPIQWGSEFRVNSIIAGNQSAPAITALADGRFVAMWSDDSHTLGDSDGAVHGQVFRADGSKAGPELLVNTFTLGQQEFPAIAALADGGFAVAWAYDDQVLQTCHAQAFGPDGAKSGAEIFGFGSSADAFPDVAPLDGGGFVVTWTDSGEIHAQRFDASGARVGGAFVVNADPFSDRALSSVAALTNGRFVVAWESEDPAGNGNNVSFQLFNANGTKFGSAHDATDFSFATQGNASVTALPEGRFVLCWANALSQFDISAQVFNANGSRSGAQLKIDSTMNPAKLPDIVGLADGRFFATWQEENVPGDSRIVGQLFAADGTRSGAEFVVNSATGGTQDLPAVTVLADGRLVVAWHDAAGPDGGGDGDQSGIRAQILDPRESGAGITGTGLNDDLVGTGFADKMKGGGGADRLAGMAGDDLIDGGGGDDTAAFAHAFNAGTVMDFGSQIVVVGPDGTDTLRDIEHLAFADATITPVDDGNPLFDTLYYLSRNPDVFHAGVNALDHFNANGWHEGRDPNAFFDTSEYLSLYPDAAASGMNPLDHYHQIGWHRGHDPAANFDTRVYLARNPDVAAAGVDPLQHFLQFGAAEGRQASTAIGDNIVGGFDAEYYRRHNTDVAAAGVDPLAHYNMFGWHESRNPNAWFDTAGYLAHYTDVAAAGVDPLAHYMQFGWKEGRDPSAAFDTNGYLAANPDVAAAHANPLEHFLTFGIYEGRQAVNDGMWH